MTSVGILGHGVVGSAQASIFQTAKIFDPVKDYHDDVLDTDVVFVCVPTPCTSDGSVDLSILRNVLGLLSSYVGVVVIKSTVPPKSARVLIDDFKHLRIVINPEFLTEKNAMQDILTYPIIVLGGGADDIAVVKRIYSICTIPTFFANLIIWEVSPEEACLIKYTISSFLAVKVVFMNQMCNVLSEVSDLDWSTFAGILNCDPRIGESHMMVPGDHGPGFSGACFPKDTKAIVSEFDSLSLIKEAIDANEILRSSL